MLMLHTCQLLLCLMVHSLTLCSLLDPSCSGSGIINRLDHLLESGGPVGNVYPCNAEFSVEHEENEEREERLSKLATFQLNVIKHAMKCR